MRKYILPLLLIMQCTTIAQVPSVKAVKDSLDKYSTGHLAESVYIQYDRPVYNPGETIWFKAYIVTAEGATNLSKNFYVDVTDTSGTVLMHGVYPIQLSAAAGNFDIPVSYKGKSIHVRAYTRWMLNFDTAFLYDKDIRTTQTPPPGTRPVVKPTPVASVQFFPEGGDCIAGIKTKLAFKALYNNGMPANINGTVVNSKGEVVDTITTLHDGMGYFYLEAQPGETYTAQWKDEQGNNYKTALPAVKANGGSLQVSQSKTRVGLLITRSSDAPAPYRQMHIVATMQQQVVYIAPVNLDASNFSGGSIPLSLLGTGILQVTLLDNNWQPVAERIVFINKNDYSFQPTVHFDTVGTGRREKNVMVINVPDSLESNLSVSVTDAGAGIDSTDDIVSKLLLTGELKGNVYHPAYYFNNNSDSTEQYLDLVMLTNGWRRFKVNEIIAGNTRPLQYTPDTSYLTLSGKVYGIKPDKIKEAGSIMVILKGTNPADTTKDFFIIPLNGDGSFTQPGYSFNDTLRAYYQFASKKGYRINNSAEVTFSSGALAAPKQVFYNKANPASKGVDTTGFAYNARLAAQEAAAADLIRQSTLQNVIVRARVKTRLDTLDERYTSGMFSGGDAARQFDLVNDVSARSAISALQYLQGKVAGLMINNATTPNPSVSWRGAPTDIFVDEMPITTDAISTINVQDIAYIKVFRPPFFGSFGGGPGGAIAIYTRRGSEILPDQFGRGLSEKRVVGYTSTREFYSPDYSVDSVMHAANDIRSTLYWNPWVITTPQNHTIRLPFYNNDSTKKMRVIIEGIDGSGRPARMEQLVQ